jgi:class 3 adenylate cyclase
VHQALCDTDIPGEYVTTTSTIDDGNSQPAARTPPRAPKPRRRTGLSIQSKLLIMLLAVSIGSTLAVGVVGYISGTTSLRNAAYDQLTNVRESRSLAAETLVTQISNALALESKGATAVDAAKSFTSGFDQLQNAQVTSAQTSKVDDYYNKVFVPTLEQKTGTNSDAALFLPHDPAQTYLQANYTAPFDDFDKAAAQDNAGDGSAWSAANADFNPYFRDMATRYGYEDVMILDTKGNVVYSVYKGVDLGTNIETGPYSGSALAGAYKDAMNSNSVDYVGFTDFERYQPSYGVPTAWAVSPIGTGSELDGVIAIQFPLTATNDVMTVGQQWEAQGLGDTGESYLVGPDHLMRSISRELVQHPDQYAADAIKGGTDPDVANRIVQVNGTVELQPVNTPSVDAALKGQTGTDVETNYLGHEVLTAYAPVNIDGIDWVVISSIDTSEAFAPVADFARNLVITIAAILLVVSLLSLVLAQVFTRPVRGLVGAVRRVGGGELGVEVPQRSGDEFGDLAVAFNDMSKTLQIKQDLIDEQRAENDKILRTVMPDAVAQRYREGEDTIAEIHEDVAVVFADLVGFDDFAAALSPDDELRFLNDLLRGFDEAAERTGIEKVRTLREGYLASCGLVTPRVDNVRRVLEFTLEMQKVLDRFNGANGSQLSLRAGVDAGTVTSGLVGRANIAYDMWGEAVSLANRVQGVGGRPGIFVTAKVRETMADAMTFTEAGSVETRDGTETVWELVRS